MQALENIHFYSKPIFG